MLKMMKSTVFHLCIMSITFHLYGGEYLKNMHGFSGPCKKVKCNYGYGCDMERGHCLCDGNTWGPACENNSHISFYHGYGHCHPNKTEYARYDICTCKSGFYGMDCGASCGCHLPNTIHEDGQPKCHRGVCVCVEGAYGKRCEYRCNCPNNEKCYRNGFCKCTTNTYGRYCNISCNCHAEYSRYGTCSRYGGYGQCHCKLGYRGQSCAEKITDEVLPIIYNTEEASPTPWIVTFIDQTSPRTHYCIATILKKFFIITTPECFTTVEQAQNLEIITRDNVTYLIDGMLFIRDVVGDVYGPILLKINSALHPSGLVFNGNTQPIGLMNEALTLDRNPGMSVGLKHGGSRKTQIGNYTHVSDTDCLNEYYMNEDENIFCAKAANDPRDNGCLLVKGSPFTLTYGGEGMPYLAGIKYSGFDRDCQFERVYHYLKISRHYDWIMEMIDPSPETLSFVA